jgi:hypothetical protein
MPQRNLERIRELLFLAESVEQSPEADEHEKVYVDIRDDMIAGDSYQLTLMKDAGWIDGRHVSAGVFRLTNSGHDYLDAVRDQGVWEKTKAAVIETGGSATLEIVKNLAIGFLKSKIEKHTGLSL